MLPRHLKKMSSWNWFIYCTIRIILRFTFYALLSENNRIRPTNGNRQWKQFFQSVCKHCSKKQNYEFPVLRRGEQIRQMRICAELKIFPSVISCFSLNIVSGTFGETAHSAHERINCFIC